MRDWALAATSLDVLLVVPIADIVLDIVDGGFCSETLGKPL